MINIAPIEAHFKSAPLEAVQKVILNRCLGRLAINSNDNVSPIHDSLALFPYTYIYGLLVHKLAHFFDVVHGTRHEFFMDEYRCMVMLDWVLLLTRCGFDPEQIMLNHPFVNGHLWQVVF